MKAWGLPALIIGGVEDHIHALVSLSRNYALKKIVEEVKKSSSKSMKTRDGTGNQDFAWPAGCAAFSAIQSGVDAVRRYLERREAHHRKMASQDEMRALFTRHGIEFDERRVWE